MTRSLVVDFDGTITESDLLQPIAVRFGDPAVVDEVDLALDEGRITLRDEISREYEPVTAPLEEVVAWVLEHSRIRPGLRELVDLAESRGWRFVILSSGFEELIRPVLAREGVDVELLANRVEAHPNGWRVQWRDESICAECGESCKRAALPSEGEIVYVGDGYSDRCAALASQRVFATRGLARHFDSLGVPYEPFDDFFDIVAVLDRDIAAQAS